MPVPGVEGWGTRLNQTRPGGWGATLPLTSPPPPANQSDLALTDERFTSMGILVLIYNNTAYVPCTSLMPCPVCCKPNR